MGKIQTAILVAILVPTTTAIGAYYQLPLTSYLPILTLATIIVFMAMGKLKYLPLYIFVISLSLLWQASMLGVFVVGSDITGEYGISNTILMDGSWDWTRLYAGPSGSSVVVGLLAPWITKVTTLDLVMVYKLVIPFIFAFVPVVLFYAFKKMFGETRAFFAALFFMIVPCFNLEIVTIAKSMVGELFFALMILAMVSDWRARWKVPAMIAFLGLASVCHYTVGMMAMIFLLCSFVARIVISPTKWSLFSRHKMSLVAMAIVLIASAGIWYGYYSKVSEGVMVPMISKVGTGYIGRAGEFVHKVGEKVGEIVIIEEPAKTEPPVKVEEPPATEPPVKVEEPTKTEPPATEPPVKVEEPTKTEEPPKPIYLQEQGSFVRAALGLDFFEVSIAGALFRITQYMTEAMLILGAVWLLFKHRRYKFTAEFIGCIGAAFLLLGCCIFVLDFATIINMTRFFQIALFFLAPVFVLGVDALSSGLMKVKDKIGGSNGKTYRVE